MVTRWKLRWLQRHEVATLLRETQPTALWTQVMWKGWSMVGGKWLWELGKAPPSSCKAPGEEREDSCSRPQRPRNAVTWARNTNRWQDTSSPDYSSSQWLWFIDCIPPVCVGQVASPHEAFQGRFLVLVFAHRSGLETILLQLGVGLSQLSQKPWSKLTSWNWRENFSQFLNK